MGAHGFHRARCENTAYWRRKPHDSAPDRRLAQWLSWRLLRALEPVIEQHTSAQRSPSRMPRRLVESPVVFRAICGRPALGIVTRCKRGRLNPGQREVWLP